MVRCREGCDSIIVDGQSFEHDQMMIAPGQAGQILSMHYDDLMSLWAKGGFLMFQMNLLEKLNKLV